MLLQIKTRRKALTKKDNHKSVYNGLINKVAKEKHRQIHELTDEININDLVYYFKNSTATKNLIDFESGAELLKKRKSGQMKVIRFERTAKYI